MPDVVILDLSMPLLDGHGVLEQLRAARLARRPRIIVLTAYGSIQAAVKATRLGASDFLEKPIVPADVREAVQAALNEPETHGDGLLLVEDLLAGGYGAVLNRARKALRLAEYADAETLLMKAADLADKDAVYFNLLGVLYEVRGQHRLARKFYGKAIAANGNYEPAQKNMRRLYELQTFGRTREPATLGDEPGEAWYCRIPEEKM